jgi:hypothetical protein
MKQLLINRYELDFASAFLNPDPKTQIKGFSGFFKPSNKIAITQPEVVTQAIIALNSFHHRIDIKFFADYTISFWIKRFHIPGILSFSFHLFSFLARRSFNEGGFCPLRHKRINGAGFVTKIKNFKFFLA